MNSLFLIIFYFFSIRLRKSNKHKLLIYNFQRWMSRLSQRWRTQRNAIRNANCRIQWIIKSLNAYCASGYTWEHSCLSVRSHLSTLSLELVYGYIIPPRTRWLPVTKSVVSHPFEKLPFSLFVKDWHNFYSRDESKEKGPRARLGHTH